MDNFRTFVVAAMFGMVALGLMELVLSLFHSQLGLFGFGGLVGGSRNEFYDRMEPLAPAGMASLRSGDAVSRVINDCERIEPFYAHTIAPAIAAITTMGATRCHRRASCRSCPSRQRAAGPKRRWCSG